MSTMFRRKENNSNNSNYYCCVALGLLALLHASWGLQERTTVLLYNKPINVVTSHAVDDVKGRPNVYQDVFSMKGFVGSSSAFPLAVHPAELASSSSSSFAEATGIQSRLHAVGRLDAETSGALLLTNDGRLVHHVTNHEAAAAGGKVAVAVSKTYHAVIMGYHSDDEEIFQQMREEGVDIGEKYGGRTRPVEDLHVLDHPTTKSTTVSLTISQGRNRQIRRMFHAVGSGVMKLKRTCIGNGLGLSGLQEGQWRLLSDEEIQNCLLFTPRLLVQGGGGRKETLLRNNNNTKDRKPNARSRRRQRNKR